MASESTLAPNFPAAEFRTAIQQTMLMGMPEDEADRLTFHWDTDPTYQPTEEDLADEPLDWDTVPTTETVHEVNGLPVASLSVPYALEFSSRPAGTRQLTAGDVDTSRGTVTMLDEDFDQIATADWATIGPTRYRIEFEAPEIALFPVGVHTLYIEAEDQV